MPGQPEKSFSIFVSSTFADLKEYREVTATAIRKLRTHVNDMIDWPADDRSPENLSLAELHNSDLILLIIAHRYGTIPENEEYSITEKEFDEAVKCGKPILAFLVNSEFAWLPDRFDTKNYAKLVAFKEKVKNRCTPQYFTTPESLAGLVFQAILDFDERNNFMQAPREQGALPVVYAAKGLDLVADLLIQIGFAEDGIPLVLEIHRSDNIEEEPTLSDKVLLRRRAYTREASKEWTERGIHEIESSSSLTRCFVTQKQPVDLFPKTLSSYLLQSPIISPTMILAKNAQASEIISAGGENRFLGISPDCEEMYVISQSFKQFSFVRNFVTESINFFSRCKYRIVSRDRDSLRGNLDMYAQDLTQEFRRDVSGKSQPSVIYRIERAEIAHSIKGLLERVEADFHQQQWVHGDLKPPNCLLSTKGIIPIDALRLEVGDISPALTTMWSALEQMQNQPVATATDVYPIGLMLVSLLAAHLGGEIVKYQLLSRAGEVHVVSIVRDPHIYLVEEDLGLSDQGRSAWGEILGRFLRFDPAKRYPDMQLALDALSNLLNDHPLAGEISFEFQRGRLQMLQLDNVACLCRVVRDKPHGNLTLCPVCDAVNRSTARFCSQCGSSFGR